MSAASRSCPVLLVAAPASGQGKSTVTAALARLHTRAGRRVRVFKCGPDFLDPFWHGLASNAPVYQVDLWMTGEADIRARLADAAQVADLILIEGVMGLYDGTPSAADLARLLNVPVLAVVDASAMAQTFGALAHGLQHFQTATHGPLRWAGVLANRVASDRHADMLRESVPAPAGDSATGSMQWAGGWLGALMRTEELAWPERHLGLVAAHEVTDAMARLDAAADALALTPLGQMSLADMQAAWGVSFDESFLPPALSNKAEGATEFELCGRTVAVARDAALCFIYEANLQTLRQLGAEVVFFSPLADAALPPCDAVWLPGGYPELHAATLATNHALRDALRDHAAQGKPVWAECGGMMLLFDELVDKAGATHTMWGLLPGRVVMQKRLAALGPQQLDVPTGSGGSHGSLRGHTFHWSLTDTPLLPIACTQRPGPAAQPVATGADGEALYAHGSVRASYFHAWFPSAPTAVAALLSPQPLVEPMA
jgi:cobyrinic acid a,c-diamide synthase